MVVSSRLIRNVGFLWQFLTFLMFFFFSSWKGTFFSDVGLSDVTNVSFSEVTPRAVLETVFVNYISLKVTGWPEFFGEGNYCSVRFC